MTEQEEDDTVGELTAEDLEEQEQIDAYGQRLNPSLIPQDIVQADFVWYDPEKDSKNIVSKNMTLSFLEEHDLDWVYMTVDLINILDMINTNMKTQYIRQGIGVDKLQCLIDGRNDIKIELDTRLAIKRSLKGRTAILSRTATHRIQQTGSGENQYGEPLQKKKTGLRKLWPL